MLNPVVANEVARARRQDMMKQAEEFRQAKRARRERQHALEAVGQKPGSVVVRRDGRVVERVIAVERV